MERESQLLPSYSQSWKRLIVAGVLFCVVGCSSSSTRPDLVPVKGRVTLDGQPLKQALIVFRSETGGRGSRSITDSNGNFELNYLREIKGAQPGKNTVIITTATEGQPVERVPSKYNKESTLIVDVPESNGTFDFDLSSK